MKVFCDNLSHPSELHKKDEACYKPVKPFSKTEAKVTTATIDENGDVLFLASTENDVFLELGNVVTQRASHVEPVNPFVRPLFHFLRLFGNKNSIAQWTRGWRVLWRVNTKPVGGPVLTWKHIPVKRYDEVVVLDYKGTVGWRDREEAIRAEVEFLNKFFLTGRA